MASPEQPSQAELQRLYDDLYERYGKPFEGQHRGAYLAISPRGETVLGQTLGQVAEEAAAKLGPGLFLYRVGERTVGKWR